MDTKEELIKIRLAEIAILIKNGQKASKFQAEIDILLGTELAERNSDAEQVYEDYRRGNE